MSKKCVAAKGEWIRDVELKTIPFNTKWCIHRCIKFNNVNRTSRASSKHRCARCEESACLAHLEDAVKVKSEINIEMRAIDSNDVLELNGMTEYEDAELGLDQKDVIDHGEMKDVDWKVKVGPWTVPTRRERKEHEATHVPFRD